MDGKGIWPLNPLYIHTQSLEKWRMPIRRMFPFPWLLLCFILAAISGSAALADSPFIADKWNVEDGLPDNEVFSILQAKDGYLWIGTPHGLVRFDGSQFKLFDEMNTPALKSEGVFFLYEDGQTNLWIGTQSSGLAVIQNGRIKSFEKETAPAGTVTAANENSGDVQFYSENGFAQYHNGVMNYYPSVRSLELYLLAKHMIIPSKNGGEWRIWGSTIQKMNGNRVKEDLGPPPWKALVTAGCEDDAGNLIIGTLGDGVFWFNAKGGYEHISTDNGLSSDLVLSLCFDDEGNLWVGTDGSGLNRVKRKIFSSPENFHPWAVQSVSQDATGGFWAAITSAGMAYWQSNSTKVYPVGNNGREAWTVLVDRQQRVWVGSQPEWAGSQPDGLFYLQSNRFIPSPDAGALGQNIQALFESHDGQLWVGSQNGLGCWDGKNWRLFTISDGLSDNSVNAIAEDSTGNLWIGTKNGGVDYFNGQKFTSYQVTNGLPGNDISCLYMDDDGVLWAGTSAHGLTRFGNGQWKCFSTHDGLASDSIGYIVGDDEGNLWIGSNRGLMRIPRASLAGTNSFFCRIYGPAEGLPTIECSSGSQPAAIRGRDGQLWFPTVKGLVSVNPSNLHTNSRPPQVLIESAEVDTVEQNTNPLDLAWSPAAIIPPGGEELVINYTALNFSSPQAVRFKYRLEGHPWIDASSSRVARYPDLQPGQYRFQVIACNEDGITNEIGATMDITALPQFWQTNTFRIVVIFAIIGAIIGIVSYLFTQKLQRQAQLLKQQETLERERGRIARDLHDQLGANLTQVALLGEMAEADKNLPDEVASHTRQISQTARETTRSLDEIVWAINPSNDTLEGLANYVCKYAQEYLALADLPCRVDVPAQLPAAGIPPEVRHNVFLAFKEAIHNVVKHAQAHEVWIRLRLQPESFELQVEDNGRGMVKLEASNRNGLRNMKKRMDDIGGKFSISPGAHGGTIVLLTVPLNL